MPNNEEFAAARKKMVDVQLVGRGIKDVRVLAAMAEVPREAFVSPDLAPFAYDDGPLPVLAGQTISQPYMVALMLETAEIGRNDRVLEIGTGSGYGAAILGRLARRVHSIERDARLFEGARRVLLATGHRHVDVRLGDGGQGCSDAAPFDVIIVTAAAPSIRPAFKEQLAIGGRLVAPIGTQMKQRLVRITRIAEAAYQERDLGPVMFVPLL